MLVGRRDILTDSFRVLFLPLFEKEKITKYDHDCFLPYGLQYRIQCQATVCAVQSHPLTKPLSKSCKNERTMKQ